ncbi:hypothetical protein Hanom_Chr02g00139741 [Helianthus anomalus]
MTSTKRKFIRNSALVAEVKESTLVAVVKERTKEEILQEKTYRERCFVDYRIEEMQQEYEEAMHFRIWDEKREYYINSKGEPVVHPSQVVYNDVLAVIPLSGKYYSNVEDYVKKLDKIIRDVMTASLRQKERMKKNVENLVNELRKVAEEKDKEVKEEEVAGEEEHKPTKEAIIEIQQNEENWKKKEEVDEEKQEEANKKLEKSGEGS